MAYARAAKAQGAGISEGVQVTALTTNAGRSTGVRLADDTAIEADTVILCAGAWSRDLAATANIALPLASGRADVCRDRANTGLARSLPCISRPRLRHLHQGRRSHFGHWRVLAERQMLGPLRPRKLYC